MTTNITCNHCVHFQEDVGIRPEDMGECHVPKLPVWLDDERFPRKRRVSGFSRMAQHCRRFEEKILTDHPIGTTLGHMHD